MKDETHSTPATRYVCGGCGAAAAPHDLLPFRCAAARPGDDIDHVMRRELDARAVQIYGGPSANPFLRYRELFHSYHTWLALGLEPRAYARIVSELDGAVAEVDGAGFRETPFVASEPLATALGLGGEAVTVKNETGGVSGSHKARHLMAVMIALRAAEECSQLGERPPLAIASCGNAALAAAVIARAVRWPLEVMIPPWAEPEIVDQLRALDASLVVCPRPPEGTGGDPCVHRFLERVGEGALPFTCQGPYNGLVIEGGATLGAEMVSALARRRAMPDRIFVQVGGGALTSSILSAFFDAVEVGLVHDVPRLHAVQSDGAAPLVRAYARLSDRILARLRAGGIDVPVEVVGEERAQLLYDHIDHDAVEETLRHAASHRSHYMWPWESEPQSIAHGILDDETYDWLAIVHGMITTGGYPIVVDDETVVEAYELAHGAGFDTCHTGAAGLAGALLLARRGVLDGEESVTVLATGVDRS